MLISKYKEKNKSKIKNLQKKNSLKDYLIRENDLI